MQELFHVEHFLKTQFSNLNHQKFLKNIKIYLNEYFSWNGKINISAIKTQEGFWEKHILDSLVLAKIIDNDFKNSSLSFSNIVDLGSGAGFPGVVLGLALNKKTIMIDKVLKKISFIKQSVNKLDFADNFDAKQLNFLEFNLLDKLSLKKSQTIIVSRAVSVDDLLKLSSKQKLEPVFVMTTNKVLKSLKQVPKYIKIKVFSYAHFLEKDKFLKDAFVNFSDYIVLKMFHVKHK